VIGCLTSGFEVLSQNLLLVALPVVLDLVLWLGPRISVEPLLQGVEQLLISQQAASPEVAGQVEQAVQLLEQFGESFNLVSVLGGVPMFQVPSLLARRAPGAGSPMGDPRVLSLSSVLTLIPWWGVLAFLGLGLGFLYLNEIAHQVGGSEVSRVENGAPLRDEDRPGGDSLGDRIDPGAQALAPAKSPVDPLAGLWKFLRFVLFAFGLMVIGSALFPLWVLVVALGTSIAQPVGILLWVGGVGLLSYAALHLLFVIPGLLLGERGLLRAIGESVLLSHVNLSSMLGFVLLTLVIYEGLGYAWSLPRSDSWAMLIGILGNAFVATGLTSAAFVFYRDRMMVGGE
jgi:hypothetical protein